MEQVIQQKSTIGMVAAMPEEIRPLLRRVDRYRQEMLGEFRLYHFTRGAKEIYIVESGMGLRNAAAATMALLAKVEPDLVISFGFAGAVTAGPDVGDLIIASRILFHRDRLFSEQQGISAQFSVKAILSMDKSLHGTSCHIYEGTFVTAEKILSKADLATKLPTDAINPCVEMETAAVARMTAKERLPLLAVRAVSDPAEEELGFPIDDFADAELRIRWWKVAATILRKPWILPQLMRLARNSRKAGMTLAAGILAILDTPDIPIGLQS